MQCSKIPDDAVIEIIGKLPKLEKRYYDITLQLTILKSIASKLGLYDASAFLNGSRELNDALAQRRKWLEEKYKERQSLKEEK